MITVRRAGPEDLEAINALQAQNLLSNLSVVQRADGFLSAAFSAAQLLHMTEDLGIDVAYEGAQMAGYLCAFRCDDRPLPPIIETMLAAYPDTCFDGRPLAVTSHYLYGPVCIARPHRGGTVLWRLFEAQRLRLLPHFSTGAAFIAEGNPRSLRAHTHKLGMRQAGTFQHNDARHHIVAFHTQPPGDPHGKQ